MPNTPNASFIPKQGPVRKVRQTASRQIQLVTVVSYVLFVSTMVAAGGVYLYNRHLGQQLDDEVQKLGSAIGGFNEADMNAVQEFNIRLRQAQLRLNNTVSITSIFEALEDATLKSASLTEVSIKREADTQVLVAAKVSAPSFDGSLFQRGVFERNAVIKDVAISDLTLKNATEDKPESGVSFVAKITVPLSEIPFNPDEMATPDVVVEEVVATTSDTVASSSDAVPVHEEN